MTGSEQLSLMQRWLRQPQRVWVRRALFQVHLWSGIGAGLYILFISVTGSVLVYRNELYVAATPEPYMSRASGPLLSDEELTEAALRSYPGYRVTRILRADEPEQGVEISLDRGEETRARLFDPRTGVDVGRSEPIGIWLVSTLIELHSDLLGGTTGRKVNGLGAVAVLLSAVTGLIVWWPGVARWRRSLTLRRGVGWKRLNWDIHSFAGFWSVAFIAVFALSGLYLCVPDAFHEFADRLEPPTAENAGTRFIDGVLYWLAFLHFGRINGIGLPCSGPGLCDQATKFVWAVFGLAPGLMFVTGAIMWWNRKVQPRLRRFA